MRAYSRATAVLVTMHSHLSCSIPYPLQGGLPATHAFAQGRPATVPPSGSRWRGVPGSCLCCAERRLLSKSRALHAAPAGLLTQASLLAARGKAQCQVVEMAAAQALCCACAC